MDAPNISYLDRDLRIRKKATDVEEKPEKFYEKTTYQTTYVPVEQVVPGPTIYKTEPKIEVPPIQPAQHPISPPEEAQPIHPSVPPKIAAPVQRFGIFLFLRKLLTNFMASRYWWVLPLAILGWFVVPTWTPEPLAAHINAGKYISIYDGHQNLKVFVRDEGPRVSEAIVLLHGFPTSSYLYRSISPKLVVNNFRTVAFDWPGLGMSDSVRGPPYSWNYFSRVLSEVLSVLDVRKAHLVVHDIAGPIAALYAIHHPNRVASLTFSNTFLNTAEFRPPFNMFFWRIPLIKHFAFWFWSYTPTPLKYLVFHYWLSKNIDYSGIQGYEYLLQDHRATALKIMNSYNYSQSFSDYLLEGLKTNANHIPMQLIWSSGDILPKTKEQSAYIKHNFPAQVKKEVWLDSYHLIQEDAPEEFSKAILDFVSSQKSTTITAQ